MDTTELQNQAIEIRDAENEGENTALRVGTMLLAIIEALSNIVDTDTLQQVLADYASLSGTGIVNWRQSRCVLLDSMGANLDNIDGGNWEYVSHNGDIIYNPSSKNLRVVGEQGNYSVLRGVIYINAHSCHAYKWDVVAQDMVEIVDSSSPTVITYRNAPAFADIPIGASYFFYSSSGYKIGIKIAAHDSFWFDPDPKKIYAFTDTRQTAVWNASNQTWITIGAKVVNNLTDGGDADALSAEMGKTLKALIDNIGIDGSSILKDVTYREGNFVFIFETSDGDKVVNVPLAIDLSEYVPVTRKVNGKELSQDITIGQSDIQGLVEAINNAGKVKSVTINGTKKTPDAQTGDVDLGNVSGTQGPAGADGADGKSAYQSYLDTTSDNPKKTEAEWVASLKGATGATGATGPQGPAGPQGNSGVASADGVIVVNNLTEGGTEEEVEGVTKVKVLSAEMGKEIGEDLYGSDNTYTQKAANGLHTITNNVVSATPDGQALRGSIIKSVKAGDVVTYNVRNSYQVTTVVIVSDGEYNVLDTITVSGNGGKSGTYNIIQDGYFIAQGFCNATDQNAITLEIASAPYFMSKDDLNGRIADNCTTDDATKILSAKQGKRLGDVVFGSTETHTASTSAKSQYAITNGVLTGPTTPSVNISAIKVPVSAGMSVTWSANNSNVQNYHKFSFVAVDEDNNVIDGSTSTGSSGTYSVAEDGYIVVQGWYTNGGATATLTTKGVDEIIGNIGATIQQYTDGLRYTEDVADKVVWTNRLRLSNGSYTATDHNYYRVSDYIRISPSTKIIVKKTHGSSSHTTDIISFFADETPAGFISAVTQADVSAEFTEFTAPSNANFIRLCAWSNFATDYDAYEVRFEVVSYLRTITESLRKWDIVLPAYVDGASGTPTNLFCDQFMSGVDDFYVRNALLYLTERNEKVVSLSGGGAKDFVICDHDGVPIAGGSQDSNSYIYHKRFTYRANSRTGAGNAVKNVLFIGDSLMAKGPTAGEAYRLLAEDGDCTINQIGTKNISGDGISGRCEAYEGMDYKFYTSATGTMGGVTYNNPFWNSSTGKVDMQNYMANNFQSLSGIDYVLIGLGANDVRLYGIDTIINNAKALVDAILDSTTGYPNAKIAIGLQSLGAPFGGTAGDAGSFTLLDIRSRMLKLNKRLIEVFDNGAYKANVTTTAYGAMLYGWESYNSTDTAVNGYCEETMRRYTDAVHPKTIGYKQWGYAFYCKIRAFLAGNL